MDHFEPYLTILDHCWSLFLFLLLFSTICDYFEQFAIIFNNTWLRPEDVITLINLFLVSLFLWVLHILPNTPWVTCWATLSCPWTSFKADIRGFCAVFWVTFCAPTILKFWMKAHWIIPQKVQEFCGRRFEITQKEMHFFGIVLNCALNWISCNLKYKNSVLAHMHFKASSMILNSVIHIYIYTRNLICLFSPFTVHSAQYLKHSYAITKINTFI